MRYLAFALGLLAVTPVSAQEMSEAEAQVLPRLIDSLCIDLVEGRNGCETAVLLASVEEPDAADLVIFSDRRAFDEQVTLLVVRNIAFNGPMFGQAPWLEQAENGSLLLLSEQIGIGRSPWSETLTISFRDSAFLVTGRTYSTYDRIAGGNFTCDVNLLTGDWTASAVRTNGETGDVVYETNPSGNMEGTRTRLADWSWDRPMPAPCSTELTAWWAAEPQ